MKNILLVIDCLGSGGAQNQLTLLAVGLKKHGYNVTVFTYYKLDFFKYRLDSSSIPVVFEKKNNVLGINVIRRIAKVIDVDSIDVIISYLHTPNFYASVARLLSKKKSKLIVSYRSYTVFSEMNFLTLSIRKFVNKSANVIVANSHHEREKWTGRFKSLEYKCFTVYNGVDKEKYYYSGGNKVVKNTFLVVGSVGPAKNGLVVIEALKILVDKGFNANVKWIGKKMPSIPKRKKYSEEMTLRINKYGLEGNWQWENPQQDLSLEYKSHQALILASTVEGLPNVVCEALSCGSPVVLSDVLDHPLIIHDDYNGYLFDPNSASSLAEAMEKMYLVSDRKYKTMSENSNISALKLFSIERMIKEYIDLMEQSFV